MRTTTKQKVHMNGSISMIVIIDDLRVRAWLELVEKIAVNLILCRSYIYRRLWGIIPGKSNVIPSQS